MIGPSFAYIYKKEGMRRKIVKRKIELVMAFILLVAAIAVSRGMSRYVAGTKVEKGVPTVVIDSGHGAGDPGKIGINGALEKDLNLEIAEKVKEGLTKKGIHVVMTREDDLGFYDESASNKKAADMKKRVSLINDTKPAMAVSIHQNSYRDGAVKGAQVFYYTHSKEGEEAAKIMQEALKALDSENTRQAKENGIYYMLKRTEVPTIIVECGFLSNAEEAKKLSTEEYQYEVAEAICNGIIKWLAK